MMDRFSERIIGHYGRHATAWDADRAKAAWNDKPWHDRFAAMMRKRMCGSSCAATGRMTDRPLFDFGTHFGTHAKAPAFAGAFFAVYFPPSVNCVTRGLRPCTLLSHL
jgi:hypothetical protein